MPEIQIKGVPDEARKVLAAEAAGSGTSFQTYLLGLLEQEARCARNRKALAQTPLPDANLSIDEIVAAVRAARGDSFGGTGGQAV